jgi:hypothetical protein
MAATRGSTSLLGAPRGALRIILHSRFPYPSGPCMLQEYQAEVTLPNAWPVALGYAAWVEEVWANYISNALKYGGQPPQVEFGR